MAACPRAGACPPPPPLPHPDELPGKRKKRGGGPKRKTRAMLNDSKVPKTFARLMEDVGGVGARGWGRRAGVGDWRHGQAGGQGARGAAHVTASPALWLPAVAGPTDDPTDPHAHCVPQPRRARSPGAQSGLEAAAPGAANYLSAAAAPSTLYAARKFCSVCGFESP